GSGKHIRGTSAVGGGAPRQSARRREQEPAVTPPVSGQVHSSLQHATSRQRTHQFKHAPAHFGSRCVRTAFGTTVAKRAERGGFPVSGKRRRCYGYPDTMDAATTRLSLNPESQRIPRFAANPCSAKRKEFPMPATSLKAKLDQAKSEFEKSVSQMKTK